LMSMALAEGLLAIPAELGSLKKGDAASVQLLQDMDFQHETTMEL